MRLSLVVLLVLMIASLGSSSLVGQSDPEEAAPPTEFDRYWMVFLERPSSPAEVGEEEAARIQRQHLGHLTKVWREGFSLVAGPFGSAPEDALRGIVIYRGDLTEDEVRELASADPAVVAGTLEVRIRPWFTGKGALTFAEAP